MRLVGLVRSGEAGCHARARLVGLLRQLLKGLEVYLLWRLLLNQSMEHLRVLLRRVDGLHVLDVGRAGSRHSHVIFWAFRRWLPLLLLFLVLLQRFRNLGLLVDDFGALRGGELLGLQGLREKVRIH